MTITSNHPPANHCLAAVALQSKQQKETSLSLGWQTLAATETTQLSNWWHFWISLFPILGNKIWCYFEKIEQKAQHKTWHPKFDNDKNHHWSHRNLPEASCMKSEQINNWWCCDVVVKRDIQNQKLASFSRKKLTMTRKMVHLWHMNGKWRRMSSQQWTWSDVWLLSSSTTFKMFCPKATGATTGVIHLHTRDAEQEAVVWHLTIQQSLTIGWGTQHQWQLNIAPCTQQRKKSLNKDKN